MGFNQGNEGLQGSRVEASSSRLPKPGIEANQQSRTNVNSQPLVVLSTLAPWVQVSCVAFFEF